MDVIHSKKDVKNLYKNIIMVVIVKEARKESGMTILEGLFDTYI